MIEETKNEVKQVYQVKPKDPSDRKKGKLQKFWNWLKSFGNDNYKRGDRYVDAKVKKEEAEAIKIMAEATKTISEAKRIDAETKKTQVETELLMQKILKEAAEMEKQKMLEHGLSEDGKIEDETLELKDVEELKRELEEKIKLARLKYGFDIKFNIREDNKE